MSPYTILWLSGVIAEAGVVVVCIRKRLFTSVPVFCWYVVWSLAIDCILYPLHSSSPSFYINFYIVELVVDSIFQFAVLLELGWSILKPIRNTLPRHSIFILAFLILVTAAIIWPLASLAIPKNLTDASTHVIHLRQTFAALRVIIFFGMAGCSQLLSIGWRNRELQIATGLGFFSTCSLAVAIIHSHQTGGATYILLDEVEALSYLFSLLYWIYAFLQKEEVRHEFSPRVQSVLYAVAGAARAGRVSVSTPPVSHSKRHE